MPQAFIIMQIGNQELDEICAKVIVPAVEACGFEAKRVDKHNRGGLLKSEIIKFIGQSEIIVADLTNERPNCYLEVGYAMGLDKFENLILTARDDHNLDSPKHVSTEPKVHFDLQGYDVLFWNPENLSLFREELEKRIRRRLAVIRPPLAQPSSPWDENWVKRNRAKAQEGLQAVGINAFTEIQFALVEGKLDKSPKVLLYAAEQACIHTFGWPIGLVLHNEFKPRPVADGIVAEIPAETFSSYDYWALKRNGDFYLLQSLFEDERRPGYIFYDTRIVRLTEALLYCARLYGRLGVPNASTVSFRLRHVGLNGRILGKSGPGRWPYERKSAENEIATSKDFPLQEIEWNLVALVTHFIRPLLELFDFFELAEEQCAALVDEFVRNVR